MNAEESDYMSNVADVLLEARTVTLLQHLGSVMLCYVLCCAVVLFCFPFFSFYPMLSVSLDVHSWLPLRFSLSFIETRNDCYCNIYEQIVCIQYVEMSHGLFQLEYLFQKGLFISGTHFNLGFIWLDTVY